MDDALLAQPIVPLDDSYDRRSFNCGVPPLDRYLHVQAGQDEQRRVAVCFVLPDAERSRVAAYYTLSAFSVAGKSLPDPLQKKLPKYGQVPCTLLGRLAVDREYRGLGLGRHLLVDALRRALTQAAQVASWAVIVDAKNDDARRFYERYGFTAFPTAPQRPFLPMTTIVEAFR